MAPNKFEKHIKKQLQEREIQPSANAWERLSEKMDDDAPQSKKRNYFWYGMAASFIGLLILSVLFFNSGDAVNSPNNQVVDSNEETIENKTNEIGNEERDIEEDAIVENDRIEQPPAQEVEILGKNQTPELSNQVASINEADTVIESLVEKTVRSNDFKEEIINTKILEIVATVDSLEQNNDALTEAEVDDLLRNAQDEILLDKLFDQKGSVDAMALLTEVEDELDQSFRDQIFDSLKEGFLKVRTAVADRNK